MRYDPQTQGSARRQCVGVDETKQRRLGEVQGRRRILTVQKVSFGFGLERGSVYRWRLRLPWRLSHGHLFR
jgi:hypothetical protein